MDKKNNKQLQHAAVIGSISVLMNYVSKKDLFQIK